MDNEEIRMNDTLEEAPVEIQLPKVPVDEIPAVSDETIAAELTDAQEAPQVVEGEAVESEAPTAFDALKARWSDMKENDFPVLVDELKKRGNGVKEKGLEYAKKLGESGEAYKAKVKARTEGIRREGRRDELYYQIGEAAYDGHKSGEDVSAVLEYFFRKLDDLEG